MHRDLHSLAEFDQAARKAEEELAFRARLLVPEGDRGPFAVRFERGHGPSPESARRFVHLCREHREPPAWRVAAPDLAALAERIEKRFPDEERVYAFRLEFDLGQWHLSFGPYLCFQRDGPDLSALVSGLIAEIDRLPPDWRPPTSAEVRDRTEVL